MLYLKTGGVIMEIIEYQSIKFILNEKRGKKMYKELIEKLKSTPAKEYTVQEAEKLADKILEIKGLVNKVAPTPIVSIAKDFGFVTYKADNIPEGISGNIFVGGNTEHDYGNDKIIIVSANDPLPHQRFIVAHELAHYLMDYLPQNKNNNEYIFSRAYHKSNANGDEEEKADRFAAEILMPRQIFISEYANAMTNSDYNLDYTIPYLAGIFNVKESCISKRIQEVL